MSVHEYSQGICGDGAAILKDGQPMTPEQIIHELQVSQERIRVQNEKLDSSDHIADVSNMAASDSRAEFEKKFPVPKGVYWNEISEQYDGLPGVVGLDEVEIYHGQWMGWQAARAQLPEMKRIALRKIEDIGGKPAGLLVQNEDGRYAAIDVHGRGQWLDWGEGDQGPEPVAWAWEDHGRQVTVDKAFAREIRADGEVVRPLVFGDTRPQSAVIDWPAIHKMADEYVEGYEFRGGASDYHPTDHERFLIMDAVAGLMHDVQQEISGQPQSADAESEIYKDVYEQIAELIEPHVNREGLNPEGTLPASIVSSVEIMLENYIRTQSAGVPGGWKFVPVEPTETMMRDAADNLCGQFGVDFVRPKERFARAVYRELLRFAPQPPAGQEG